MAQIFVRKPKILHVHLHTAEKTWRDATLGSSANVSELVNVLQVTVHDSDEEVKLVPVEELPDTKAFRRSVSVCSRLEDQVSGSVFGWRMKPGLYFKVIGHLLRK